MDIIAALSEGKRGAVARSTEVANFILQNDKELPILLDVLTSSDATIVSHAAHASLTIFKNNPDMLLPHRKQLLVILEECDQWEIIEQLSKILPHLKCSEDEFDTMMKRLCFVLYEGKSSIARTCALEAIVLIAEKQSVYSKQAEAALEFALNKGSKAMQARARKLLPAQR